MQAEDLAIAERLFQSLLDHFWRARDENVPRDIDQYPKGYAISYGNLVDLSGVPLDPRNAGGPLFVIAGYCKNSEWPPIHSLVVRHKEGYPGDGFFRAPGTEFEGLPEDEALRAWAEAVRKCSNFDSFPRTAPRLS